jgi:hypothetical protein
MTKSHIELMDSEQASIAEIVCSEHKSGYQEKQNSKKREAQRQRVRKKIVSVNED